MNSKSNVVHRLNQEAKKGTMHQQLTAGILKNSKLVTKPCCNIARNTCRGVFIGSLHAEAHAMINYFGKHLTYDGKEWRCSKPTKLDLVVIRINKSGNICNARPCYNCVNMMKSVGIRKVYYSINEDELVCEKVKDMISIQASSLTQEVIDKVLNTQVYYDKLLRLYFPSIVKKHNLDLFITYNIHLLPHYTVVEKDSVVYIMNDNQVILKASILY
jgi:deoxycytidylate deaminase